MVGRTESGFNRQGRIDVVSGHGGLRGPVVALGAALATALVLVTGCGGGDGAASEAPERRDAPKVTVAGDSIALGLGVAMREAAAASEDPALQVRAIGEDGTGLARPDVFDWPARLGELADEFPPEVLVFSVGSNDAQDLTDVDGEVVATMAEDDRWDAEYSDRLARVFDEFADTATTVVWVGHVRAGGQRVAEGNRHIHELATQVAADRDWVVVEDLAELTGSGAESTSRCLSDDGLHLSGDCYEQASEELLERHAPT